MGWSDVGKTTENPERAQRIQQRYHPEQTPLLQQRGDIHGRSVQVTTAPKAEAQAQKTIGDKK